MKNLILVKTWQPYLFSLFAVGLVATACYLLGDWLSYRAVALILLMTISLMALKLDILPVVIASLISALAWNFFFIPPTFTFHINKTEDFLLFLMYFFISLVHTVLTFKIRKAESEARDKNAKEKELQLYSTLLNSLSHELRTPMATIVGAVDALKDHEIHLNSHQQSELLQEISDASLRLNRQINNLLNLNRLESGMLSPKLDWCDLAELVHQLINQLPPAEQKRIHLHHPENLPLFKLDAGFLEQILHNLLLNALQYDQQKKAIHLTLEHQANHCAIKIKDQGPGFPSEHIPHIFDKFYRLPHSPEGGTGLGLSIVKGFVEALNGNVILRSNLGEGSEFSIELPTEVSYLNQLDHE